MRRTTSLILGALLIDSMISCNPGWSYNPGTFFSW
jgi:hypothetical protein